MSTKPGLTRRVKAGAQAFGVSRQPGLGGAVEIVLAATAVPGNGPDDDDASAALGLEAARKALQQGYRTAVVGIDHLDQ